MSFGGKKSWEIHLNILFLIKIIKIQDICPSFPIIAATKTARVTLTFWNDKYS